jgi:CxxC motif-containing protein
MRELTCIVCPIGCSLLVDESSVSGTDFTITGNRCARGAAYAQEEIRAPKRVVTATCGIDFPEGEISERPQRSLTAPRRIPVKTSAPCPKEKINELLDDIYRLKVSLPVKAGDRLITDWKGRKIDVVAVRSLE